MVPLLIFIRRARKRGAGGPRTLGNNFLIVLDKELLGNLRRQDPELSGAISLLFFISNRKEKGGGRILGSREGFPYCF